jgi:hypothetical protein
MLAGACLLWVINIVSSAAAHFHFSPDFGHIAASRRSATKSADARRGAADDSELRQATGAVAPVAPDKQGVQGRSRTFHDSEGEAQRGLFCGTGRFGQAVQHLHC